MVQTWLQWLILFAMLLDMVIEICRHGEVKTKEYDGIGKTIATFIAFTLYYLGGVFDGLLR